MVTDGRCEHACAACYDPAIHAEAEQMNGLGIFDSQYTTNVSIADLEDRVERDASLPRNIVMPGWRPWRLIALNIVIAAIMIAAFYFATR